MDLFYLSLAEFARAGAKKYNVFVSFSFVRLLNGNS